MWNLTENHQKGKTNMMRRLSNTKVQLDHIQQGIASQQQLLHSMLFQRGNHLKGKNR
jgi:hypothetical protein